MKIATARHLSNIPEGAIIHGGFTQPFGPGVSRDMANSRLDSLIWHNGPMDAPSTDWPEELANELTKGLDWPNDGCEITFYLYHTED